MKSMYTREQHRDYKMLPKAFRIMGNIEDFTRLLQFESVHLTFNKEGLTKKLDSLRRSRIWTGYIDVRKKARQIPGKEKAFVRAFTLGTYISACTGNEDYITVPDFLAFIEGKSALSLSRTLTSKNPAYYEVLPHQTRDRQVRGKGERWS